MNTTTQEYLQSFNDYKVMEYCMDNGDCFPTIIYANGSLYTMNGIGNFIKRK